jgi:hypothetical protein
MREFAARRKTTLTFDPPQARRSILKAAACGGSFCFFDAVNWKEAVGRMTNVQGLSLVGRIPDSSASSPEHGPDNFS